MDIDIRREVKTVHNVGAYLPGETSEYVIVGAHYDHLGLGEQFSMAPSMAGTVHPGADDNASGTAGVIELAHWFSQEPKHAPARSSDYWDRIITPTIRCCLSNKRSP